MWESITSVISNLIKILGDVCTSLFNNKLFLILLGIVVLGIIFKIIDYIRYLIEEKNEKKFANMSDKEYDNYYRKALKMSEQEYEQYIYELNNPVKDNVDFYFDKKGNIVDDDGTIICSASEAKDYGFYELAKKRK